MTLKGRFPEFQADGKTEEAGRAEVSVSIDGSGPSWIDTTWKQAEQEKKR